MTPAQRDIVAIAMLPEEERLELMRYLSAQLAAHSNYGDRATEEVGEFQLKDVAR